MEKTIKYYYKIIIKDTRNYEEREASSAITQQIYRR